MPGSSPNGGVAATQGASAAPDGAQKTLNPAGRRLSGGSAAAWQQLDSESRNMSGARQSSASTRKTKQRMRVWLHQGSWYTSWPAVKLREILHGKVFAIVMTFALFIALFMNDIWIICGVNSNLFIDVVLTTVMVLFTIELCALSAVDAAYFLSFFQIMDIVGTVSMIFDISFMYGTDATVPKLASNDGNAKKNLMLLRAARAAKIGARAGRLSRVLRILRFLPLLTGGSKDKRRQAGFASTISTQLANLLATRVACLTIVLVMVIPLFDIWTFPQNDYSLQTWVDRLSQNMRDARTADTVEELQLMGDFYDRYEYGPYTACTGQPSSVDHFQCTSGETAFDGWAPKIGAPNRMASSLVVHTDTFMVAFNMHHPAQLESGLAMAVIIFIILIMVFSGLALSSVVTELAVRPLERMLETVRMIASTVFKFSAEVNDQQDDDDARDIDSSNEMKLLEKVVHKLAIITELQMKNTHPQVNEDMRQEDLGVLSMMQGKNIVVEREIQDRRSFAVPRKKAMAPAIRLEDFGVTSEVYGSWGFNPLPLTKAQRCALAVFTIDHFHEPGQGYVNEQDEVQTLQRFIQAVEKEYLNVPFHNFAHALDVLHGTSRLMRLIGSEAYLSDLEQFSILIAAVSHDIGHPGVNNGFLSEVGHEMAIQYNDRSPLENMHCAKLYTIAANPATNVFGKLSKEDYKEVRKNCIETILHTDMMVHQAMVKDLQMTYQMNTEVFVARPEDGAQGANSAAEVEVFAQPETKVLVMECILHSADVSNPCKVWDVTHAWAMVCLEEFFLQGEKEKKFGIPVQFLNDRDKLNKPNSQIGFIEFMIAPFFAAQVRLWPAIHELGDNLGTNLRHWEESWEKETGPSEEEKGKVKGRVEKVCDNLQDAAVRGTGTNTHQI